MSKSDCRWVNEEIERIRELRKQQGHTLTPLQEGMVAAIASWDPRFDPSSAEEFRAIQANVQSGRWEGSEEWRIGTWFNSSISKFVNDGKPRFVVTVRCDGQSLACECPTLNGAYAYMRLYENIIVEQFYSVGPPWRLSEISCK